MTSDPSSPLHPLTPSPPQPLAPVEAARRPPRWRAISGFGIGVLLIAAAIWAVASQDMGAAWEAAARRPHGLVAVAFFSLVNWMLMAAVFSALIKPFGRVDRPEMAALIGASWLLNYLPMRPGMLGRVAYHKTVNGIAVRDALKTIAGNIGCGFVAMGCGALAALTARPGWAGPVIGLGVWVAAVAAPAVVLLGATALASAMKRPLPRSWAVASLLRYADLWVWAARYGAVFWVMGREIDLAGALAIAVVSQAASLIPIVGNGLGIREWAVGLTAAAMPAWMLGSGGMEREIGLAADLVNRAAEVAAAVPVGLLSAWWLAGRRRAAG